MKSVNRAYSSIVLCSLATLLLTGCGGIKVDRLVPEDIAVSKARFAQSLHIVEPVGGQKSVFGVQDYIENGEMHGALMGAFEEAQMFASVSSTGPADLELHCEIIEVAASGGFDMTFAFVTQYWIIDTRSGEEIWRKGINARNEERLRDTWSGSSRAVKALEGAVQNNIERLLEELSKSNLGQ